MQKQYKIVAIYLFLVTDFASWDNCNIKIGNLANLVHKFDNNLKNAELVLMLILYFKKFGDLKLKNLIIWIIQLFNLIWYKKYWIEIEIQFGQ